jgi:asparagine synthase (glutamine-hydrolysing)
MAARAVGAEHREVVVSSHDFFDTLPRLVWHEDEPIAFPSSVPLYFVSRLAREHVKVVLTGEGADELFLGYNRYRVTAWNDRLGHVYGQFVPKSLRQEVSRLVTRLPRAAQRYAERSFFALQPNPRTLFFENFAVFSDAMRERVLSSAGSGAIDPYADGLRCYSEADGGVLQRMSAADLQTYLVELLMKQDQMSMAASIESRVPFLDHHLVERVVRMPSAGRPRPSCAQPSNTWCRVRFSRAARWGFPCRSAGGCADPSGRSSKISCSVHAQWRASYSTAAR